ncbi:methyl-accepting chemotaxis protein [Pseudoalteromonas sp. MMG022]|uniref:methyl-accepting chemotaxis protein n=1 Tax=Pseudoalteromonas sp. MMG022 TaxID=2909978 RepID=UPI0031B9D8F3|nr:methyl-accepting chemotaxis protein [Pseudoalteromonas sp. MMG022]
MRIKSKIVLNVAIIVAAAVIATAGILTTLAKSNANNALQEQLQNRLVGVRDAKKEQLESYFDMMQQQIKTLASSTMTVDATVAFRAGFSQYQQQFSGASQSQINTSLQRFYQQQFAANYRELNDDAQINTQALLADLSTNTRAIQYTYISNNRHPLGSKSELYDAQDGSDYAQTHVKYHDSYKQLLESFGYYDIFIVDAQTGEVIYSVFKELDFATSLRFGPYSSSGLGDSYQAAMKAQQGEVTLIDFRPYTPSYEAPAAFLSTPIFNNKQRIGVLIFQAPVDNINNIMNYDQQWLQRGLGETGETYLVGEDRLMRSQSRFFLENKSQYLANIKSQGVASQVINQIDAKNSTLGLAEVKTQAVERALQGQNGFLQANNYLNTEVVSAFAPLDLMGLRWAIVSEISTDEGFEASANLLETMLFAAVVLSIVLILMGLAIAWFLGGYLSKPVLAINDFVVKVATSLDLSLRANLRFNKADNDEIGQVGRSLNKMMQSINEAMCEVSDSSKNLDRSVSSLRENFNKVATQSTEQSSMTLQLSAAIEQMAQTSESLAQSAESSNEATHAAVEQVADGQANVEANVRNNNELKNIITVTSSEVDKVAKDSADIGSVLEVIKGIAEQTNLLALNAAIEAARAGEQGRGFAVVADEVRALAQKTQDSTKEIHNIIEALQGGSKQTVNSMKGALASVEQTFSTTSHVSASFEQINEQVMAIESYNSQVATATSEQSAVARDMAHQVSSISDLAEHNCDNIQVASSCCDEVESEYHRLQALVGRFKL